MPYSFYSYYDMIADTVRTDANSRALRAAITPGCVVAEIGTGSGYFAVLACKLGASKVYAIEPDDVIEIAQDVAEANGVTDRIEFMKALSTEIELPQKVDVLLSDLRGVLPFFEYHIPSIVDARQRLLAPGGIQIPARDELYGVCVSSPKIYKGYGLDDPSDETLPRLVPFNRRLRSIWSKVRAKPEDCISEVFHLATLDYASIQASDFRADVAWEATESKTAHGMCLWFDAILLNDIGFSNAPSESSELIYGQAFFPFSEPIHLEPGDRVAVSFHAALVRGQYVWRWDTKVVSGSDATAARADFRQTSLDGSVVSRDRRKRRAGDHVPSATENLELTRFVLQRVDGNNSLEAIAHELAASYPARFTGWTDALTFAGEAVEKSR